MNGADHRDEGIERAASEWITRQGGAWTAADQRALAEWQAADPRHAEAYARMAKTWAVFDWTQQRGLNPVLSARLEARTRARRRRRMAVAASGLILLLAVWWVKGPAVHPEVRLPAEYELALQLIRKLPDGSIVELKQGADIAVAYEPGVRRVRLLRGEAHFRVEREPGRPFVVQASGVDIVAVGTAFTVQVMPAAVEVVVTEGRIAVDRPVAGPAPAADAKAAAAVVDAGNRVVVDTTHDAGVPSKQIVAMSEEALQNRLAWRKSRLEFNDLELAAAIEMLNRANRIQLTLVDRAVGRLRVSGTFRADNPEGFVRIVEATFGLKAKARGPDEIVLYQP